MNFLLLHCPYDPDKYTGHRIEQLKATTYDDALIEAEALLSKRWNRVKWEYRLIGYDPKQSSGYKLHEIAK